MHEYDNKKCSGQALVRSQRGARSRTSDPCTIHKTGLGKESRGQGAAPPIRVRETNSKDKKKYMSVLVQGRLEDWTEGVAARSNRNREVAQFCDLIQRL